MNNKLKLSALIMFISSLSGSLFAEIGTGTLQVNPISGSYSEVPLKGKWKHGNNNTVNCNTFCQGSRWGGWSGSCLKGYDNNRRKEISCTGGYSGMSNVKCYCAPIYNNNLSLPSRTGTLMVR